MFKNTYYLIILCLLFVACKEKTVMNNTTNEITTPLKNLEISYAKGFSVSYYPDYKLVTVLKSGFASPKPIQYALIKRGEPKPNNLPQDATVIEIPLQSIVCLSTTHAPLLNEIGEIDKIVGFSDIKYSGIVALQTQAKNGKTKDVGGQNGVTNTELIISLQPNVVMSYSEKDYHTLTKLGQKVLINTEYLENSPLGRAEWIKFGAVFFDKEDLATQFFAKIENDYNTVKKQVENLKTQNTTQNIATKTQSIFGTIPYSSIWYMPAGQSFAATLWKDAGYSYTWADTEGTGSLQLSIEEAIIKAQNADIWVNVGAFSAMKELIATDSRFSNFKAVKTKQVYNCNKRMTSGGGNEFYEYGVIRPDIVLKDLVKILYPELFKDYKLFFYQRLE